MRTVIQFPDGARAEEEAASWLARLDRGPLDSGEAEALRTWLAAHRSHREALHDLAEVWGQLDCIGLLAELFPLEPEPRPSAWKQRAPAGALGAVAVLILAIGLYLGGVLEARWMDLSPLHAEPSELVYRTDRGQQSEIRLKDGSTLTLNTDSEARVHLGDRLRSVYLTRGEAHFHVARDPQRPFEVHAGPGRVRAVGTAFNVRVAEEQVEVLVSEGTVEVMAEPDTARHPAPDRSKNNPQLVRLKQGDAARYASVFADLQSLPVKALALPVEEVEQRLAWRKGKWMFEGETLAQVLDEVSRYSNRRIIIADPDLADLRVGGYFDIGDIEGLMNALESGFGIQVVRNGDTYRLKADSREG